eukprot:Gb_28268 [translate_table: standard]
MIHKCLCHRAKHTHGFPNATEDNLNMKNAPNTLKHDNKTTSSQNIHNQHTRVTIVLQEHSNSKWGSLRVALARRKKVEVGRSPSKQKSVLRSINPSRIAFAQEEDLCVVGSAPVVMSGMANSFEHEIPVSEGSWETQRLLSEPAPGISASPSEENLRYFNVMILGPSQSPYEGGINLFGVIDILLNLTRVHSIGRPICGVSVKWKLQRSVKPVRP